ncbi:MAG TPA: SCP2 sterol-binding domain-containing protein [Micromonosporaceae bacterium]|nr:SCP2 sterol-binding domain-containing protein [Micromonosporaceae bacterium]
MTAREANPAMMDPLEFARLVKATSSTELRQMMQGDQRGAVLDELFRRMPDVFRADRAGSTDAVVHWVIGDRPDGGTDKYELVIANGTCEVSAQPERSPKLTLTIGVVDFLNLVTGNAHPVALVMKGKLKTKGDLGLTAKYPTFFDVPKP